MVKKIMQALQSHKLLAILVVAAVLRITFLSSVPIALNWDEVSMGYTSYSVMKTGADEWGEKLPLFFRSYGEWKSAVYIYLLIPFIKVLGLNAWAVRLPSAIAGIMAVYLTYQIGKKLYSEKVGLWAALFLAVSPWHLMLSRPGFEASVSLTLTLAGIHFFLERQRQSWWPLIASAVMFGLAPHTYNSAKLVVPLLVVYLIWKTQFYRETKKVMLFLGILAVFAAPILSGLITGRSQARFSQVSVNTDTKALESFYLSRRTFPFGETAGKLVFNQATYFIYKVADNWLSYLSPAFLLSSAGDHNQHSMPYHGVLYIIESIALVAGLTQLKKSSDKLKYAPLVIIALGIIPAAMTREPAHVLRTILTLPGWQLLAGVGMASLASVKAKQWFKGVLAVEVVVFVAMYFLWYPRYTASDWQYGYKEVAQYLNEHAQEYDKFVMTKWYGEPQLFLAFYNQWDPATYQKNNAQNKRYESEDKLWLDQLEEYSVGDYSFKYLNWGEEDRSSSTLFIGKIDDFWPDGQPMKTIYFPNGNVAFHLVKGDK
jgi:4-amino-4-deoxy-L-arabinose transferase-like glycosyltransferase